MFVKHKNQPYVNLKYVETINCGNAAYGYTIEFIFYNREVYWFFEDKEERDKVFENII